VWLLLAAGCNYALLFGSNSEAAGFCFGLLRATARGDDIASLPPPEGLCNVGLVDCPGLFHLIATQVAPAQLAVFDAAARALQRWSRARLRRLLAAKRARAWRVVVRFMRRTAAVCKSRRLMALSAGLAVQRSELMERLSAECLAFARLAHDSVCRQFGLVNVLVSVVRSCCAAVRPDIRVDMFGSMATGLALPSSDVDLVCNATATELDVIASRLTTATGGVAHIVGSPPVLKLKATLHGLAIKMDLTMHSPSHTGLESVQLVRHWLASDARVGPVVLVVKQLLFARGLGQVYTGGLSSHAVFVLTLAVLRTAGASVGELLVAFLSTFSTPGFFRRHALSVARGIEAVEELEERQSEMAPPAMIEDPTRPGNNLGAGSFRIGDVQRALGDVLDRIERAQGLHDCL